MEDEAGCTNGPCPEGVMGPELYSSVTLPQVDHFTPKVNAVSYNSEEKFV